MPRALIAGLQGATCSQVMPTPEPIYEALTARPEELKVLLLLYDGWPMTLTSWQRGRGRRDASPAFSSGASTWGTTPGRDCYEGAAGETG